VTQQFTIEEGLDPNWWNQSLHRVAAFLELRIGEAETALKY
jgi:hypothetical protein